MIKNINKKLIFSILIITLLLLTGCRKTSGNDSLSQKKLTSAAQFKIATEASRPDPKEFENVFGKESTWGCTIILHIQENISSK